MSDWTQRAVLFADGAHGSAIQVRQIGEGPMDADGLDDGRIRWTTIVSVWVRKDHHDRGATRWYYNDREYPGFNEAASAWIADGEPVGAVEGQRYLDPKNFDKKEE